jgi:glycosyltransferase involved in cell wall biosynthesis
MKQLHVCVVGGIFDRSQEYRGKHLFTPETVLANGLAQRGVRVTTVGHQQFMPTEAFDLVHVHHLDRAALIMATAPTRSPFVYTSHDPKLASRYRISRMRLAATQFVTDRADACIVLSTSEHARMQDVFGIPGGRMRIIANGSPSRVFCRKTHAERRAGPYRLLFVGQLIPQKGVAVLLKSLPLILQAEEVEVSLVYQNPFLEAKLRRLVAQLGIDQRVHFLGFKSAYELADLYQQADLFVLPTYAEALPTVVTEAMLCGLPVVASNVAGIPEQVGSAGRLVPPGDIEGLAGAVLCSINDLAEGKVDPTLISSSAQARFSPESMIDKHLELYQHLLATPSRLSLRRRRYRFTNWASSSGVQLLSRCYVLASATRPPSP